MPPCKKNGAWHFMQSEINKQHLFEHDNIEINNMRCAGWNLKSEILDRLVVNHIWKEWKHTSYKYHIMKQNIDAIWKHSQ